MHKREAVSDTLEKRTYQNGVSISDSRTVTGHAALFNVRTEIWPGFFEEFATGAFSDCINISDVRLLLNHESSQLLGRTKSSTLTIAEDELGLFFKGSIPNSREDVMEMITRRDLDQCSIGFYILKETWIDLGDGTELRIINKVKEILDVTLATFPAYGETSFAISRTTENLIKEREQLKKLRSIPPVNQKPYEHIARLRALNIY